MFSALTLLVIAAIGWSSTAAQSASSDQPGERTLFSPLGAGGLGGFPMGSLLGGAQAVNYNQQSLLGYGQQTFGFPGAYGAGSQQYGLPGFGSYGASGGFGGYPGSLSGYGYGQQGFGGLGGLYGPSTGFAGYGGNPFSGYGGAGAYPGLQGAYSPYGQAGQFGLYGQPSLDAFAGQLRPYRSSSQSAGSATSEN